MTLPVMQPKLPRAEAVVPYLERMDRLRIYSNFGPLCRELEERYAALLGLPSMQVVSASNATVALAGALSGFPDVRQWMLPAWTFAATGNALVHAQRLPIWLDVDPHSWLIDTSGRSSDADTGLLPVMTFGHEVLLNPWRGWRNVVIDAAASLGSMPNLSDLPRTWAVVFSLHATKVLGCGEGAIVAFGDAAAATRFRQWTNFAFDESRQSMFAATNAKMSEIACAYANAALDEWPEEAAEWDEVHGVQDALAKEFGLRSAPSQKWSRHPYWIVDCGTAESRQRVEGALSSVDIESRRWWPGLLTEMPLFRSNAPARRFPVAEDKVSSVIGLPKFRGMNAADVRRVADVVSRALNG